MDRFEQFVTGFSAHDPVLVEAILAGYKASLVEGINLESKIPLDLRNPRRVNMVLGVSRQLDQIDDKLGQLGLNRQHREVESATAILAKGLNEKKVGEAVPEAIRKLDGIMSVVMSSRNLDAGLVETLRGTIDYTNRKMRELAAAFNDGDPRIRTWHPAT